MTDHQFFKAKMVEMIPMKFVECKFKFYQKIQLYFYFQALQWLKSVLTLSFVIKSNSKLKKKHVMK